MWALCCSMEVCGKSEQLSQGGTSPQQAASPAVSSTAAAPATAASSSAAAKAAAAAPTLPRLSNKAVAEMDKLETASMTSTQKNSTRSAYSGASSIGSEFINDQIPAHQREVAKIQSQMKGFVKGMVRGREMNVLSVDGQLRACTCSFDRKLRNYNIVISKETRSIPLSKFREVFQGAEPEDIATPLDELCATFVLDSGECLSFRFKDIAERENFAMCLQIIVDGHQ
eukprot:TRINITY_DN92103_c0_g1_i1.p1 TRINITY_DN92103_c0_g1~~TRINITY_DN92103_c0_g1_i1.p1  ORF type:complete len:258 (+),score=49.62 TRINITY_DN92103_c0_g1_i1:96-776(+)